ncbi:MAG: DUF2956 domain-containing protein [Colwellia sp.]|nr:DUF2956 domain-containing protein [Colwellia sp.]MCW9080149.1 DUF2956 domain-containing protein [Colwellia sp.]
MVNKVSKETQEQALSVAKSTQKPGQTKEQTKLIAQGIEKGIALYKKQQKAKSRTRDKQKKQISKTKTDSTPQRVSPPTKINNPLPWVLLILSWLGFIGFYLYSQYQ